MEPHLTDWIQAVAALLTMGAAIAALVIASRAPRLAAKFAEEYRSMNAAQDEANKLRVGILLALMANRAELTSANARAAINSVDVAFAAFPEVRNARHMFISATLQQPTNSNLIVERYHCLIEAVLRAMGMANLVTGFDVRAGYYPEAIAKLDLAAIAEAEEKIARRAAVEAPKAPPADNS